MGYGESDEASIFRAIGTSDKSAQVAPMCLQGKRFTRSAEYGQIRAQSRQDLAYVEGELLDGSHDLGDIAQAIGFSGEELQYFLAHLRRLDLLDDRPGESSLIADRRRFLDESLSTVPAGPRLPVLLVGLGGLGLAVLRDLLGARRFTVSLFDPAPIQAADVGPFYRPAEIGQDKAHVLWTCLAPRIRGFVRRIEAGRSPHRPVEATLAPIVDAVRAVVCSDQSPRIALGVASACRSARVPLLTWNHVRGKETP